MGPVWDALLDELKQTHRAVEALGEFCPIDADLVPSPVNPAGHACTEAFLSEDFGTTPCDDFVTNIRAATEVAHWRQTYAGTNIGQDFLDRFGCYCLIGPNGAWSSSKMAAFFVYMPANLWYTWHSHPAEELYFVIAGSGLFLRDGETAEVLAPGEAMFHASNQPHALQTEEKPLLALVMWRNYLGTPPTLMPDNWSPT